MKDKGEKLKACPAHEARKMKEIGDAIDACPHRRTPSTDTGGVEKCVAGCCIYDGGERKHHPDCPHYPESLSKLYEDIVASLHAKLKLAEAVVAAAWGPGTESHARQIEWLRGWSQSLSPRDDIGPANEGDHILAEYLWRIADALSAHDKDEEAKEC